MTSEPSAVLSEPSASTAEAGAGPLRLALRRLRHNYIALAFGALFLIIVILCLLAPVYSHHIADVGPNVGDYTSALNADGIPIGPTYHSHFFFGADTSGRDLAVRLLYGGRTSLYIALVATVITMIGGVALGLVAGFFRGWTDSVISRILDLIWAYPALLLGVALGVSFAVGGVNVLGVHIEGGSDLIPAFVIGLVYIPYVARPIRGEVLTLREREFVDAARVLGYGRFKIMFSEILPNLVPTIIVFFALQLAQSVVLEASLSFLGAGVQAPNPSWGTLLSDGLQQIQSAPHLTLAPGIMLALTVLSINVVGDGVRKAFDPRARIRVER